MLPQALKNSLNSHRLLLALVIIFCILGQVGRELWTPDEPRVAAISASMARNHDWIVPDFAGIPFIEKPPLGFALYAAGSNALGPFLGSLSGMRLVNVALGLGLLWLSFALGKRLYDTRTGLRAAVILGTMLGFAANVHWLRVDLALSFFVLLAIYAFSEVLLGRRWLFAWLAGTATAGAFLTKGVVGPGIIFLAWLPLIIHAWRESSHDQNRLRLAGSQLLALTCFTLLSISWILALRRHANGDALWHTWFWVNQVGRATGNAAKGHMHPHAHFYYVAQVLQYTFPWLILPFIWTWKWIRRENQGVQTRMLGVWVIGALVILSFAAGKRAIYLLPVLPGLALITAQQIQISSKAVRWWALSVLTVAAAAAAFVALLPLYVKHYAGRIPDDLLAKASTFDLSNLAGLMVAVGVATALWKSRTLDNYRLTAASGIAVLSVVFLQLMPLAAVVKSMHGPIAAFASRIPAEQRSKIASVNLQETERGLLWVYSHWAVPSIETPEDVQAVLEGRNSRFDSLLVNQDDARVSLSQLVGQSDKRYCVLAQSHTRDDGASGELFWIAGISTTLCRRHSVETPSAAPPLSIHSPPIEGEAVISK